LNQQEINFCLGTKPKLWQTFKANLFAWFVSHDLDVCMGKDQPEDHKRACKMTEETVERHFFGDYGLEAELIDAQIMDPETKIISDARRLLNCDEVPQPLEMPQKGSREKVAKRRGRPAKTVKKNVKDNVTIHTCWD